MGKITITDKGYKPTLDEIKEYVSNDLFNAMCVHLDEEYNALYSIDYSGETAFFGWNIKYHKAGRTLCRLYPRDGFFIVLVVVGQKEKDRVEMMLPLMTKQMREKYETTQEGMGQRWLMIEISNQSDVLEDIKKIVAIRRKSK